MYRGAFGAHVAAVLRRLRRLCAFHRAAHPATAAPPLQFIACSATLADPAEHFRHLTAAEACVVDDGPRFATGVSAWPVGHFQWPPTPNSP